MAQPHENGTNDTEHPEITLLSLSVQQLTTEARALRESLNQGRTSRDAMMMSILLGVIAVAAVAMALHIIL